MKVLILVFCEYPGGSAAAFHAQRMALGLRAAGAEPMVLSGRADDSRGTISMHDDRGIPFRAFALERRRRWVPRYMSVAIAFGRNAARALDEVLSVERWDAIIYYGRSWLASMPIVRMADRHHVPVIPYQVEWHGIATELLASGQWIDSGLYRRYTLPKSPAIIGISEFWRTWAERRGISNVVIPAFADVNVNRPPPERPRTGGPFHIVFVGGWAPRELPGTLFDGLERAIELGVDVRLTVVGGIGKSRIERAAMRDFARRPQLKERTTFAGWLGGQSLADQLDAAHAFVLLREENRETKALFPTRLPEYLATGIPVILSKAGDLPLYLEHRKSAWLIPPGHAPEALGRAIEHLSHHEEERRAIGRGGWEAAASRLSCERLGQELAAFLNTVAEKTSSQTGFRLPATIAPTKPLSRGATSP